MRTAMLALTPVALSMQAVFNSKRHPFTTKFISYAGLAMGKSVNAQRLYEHFKLQELHRLAKEGLAPTSELVLYHGSSVGKSENLGKVDNCSINHYTTSILSTKG